MEVLQVINASLDLVIVYQLALIIKKIGAKL